MTKKHFITFAETLNKYFTNNNNLTLGEKDDILNAIMQVFEQNNSKFNKQQFIKACYKKYNYGTN